MTRAQAYAFISRIDEHIDRIDNDMQQARSLGVIDRDPSRADLALANLMLARSNAMLILGVAAE